jgi:hypothetical protein
MLSQNPFGTMEYVIVGVSDWHLDSHPGQSPGTNTSHHQLAHQLAAQQHILHAMSLLA